MQKLTINAPMFTVEVDGEHETELFKKAAFWLSLPKQCPLCSRPLILDYRTPQTFKYYELKCTGTPAHKTQLGQYQADGSLYFDARKPWTLAGGADPQDATPDQASRILTPKTASPDPASNNLAESKNELIRLINLAKSNGIRCGYVPADVASMNADHLSIATQKVRDILIREKVTT